MATTYQPSQSGTPTTRTSTASRLPSSPDDLFHYGVELEYKQKWKSAIPYFAKCIKVRPDLEQAWIELSRCYMLSKDFDNAAKILQQAYKRFANSPTTAKSLLLLLISNGIHAGNLEAIQHWRKEFVAKFPKEKYATTVNEEIEYYDKDFAATRKREASRVTRGLEGYLPWLQLTMMPAMPIRVCVAPGKLVSPKYTKAVSERYVALSKTALMAWESSTDHWLRFVFVSDPKNAQMRVTWTTDTTQRSHSFADGEADYAQNATQGPVCTSAVIYVEPKEIMSDSHFLEVCLHEVGHALGLQHSSAPSDVMYGSGTSVSQLSKGDITCVRSLYADPFLGKAVAEEFANAAFVNKNYDGAYKLLSESQRAVINPNQFQQLVEDSHGGLRPLSVAVNHFNRTQQRKRMNFALLGTNGTEQFYYHVSVVPGSADDFKVEQWNRIRVN